MKLICREHVCLREGRLLPPSQSSAGAVGPAVYGTLVVLGHREVVYDGALEVVCFWNDPYIWPYCDRSNVGSLS